jgi:hypothetical protein
MAPYINTTFSKCRTVLADITYSWSFGLKDSRFWQETVPNLLTVVFLVLDAEAGPKWTPRVFE